MLRCGYSGLAEGSIGLWAQSSMPLVEFRQMLKSDGELLILGSCIRRSTVVMRVLRWLAVGFAALLLLSFISEIMSGASFGSALSGLFGSVWAVGSLVLVVWGVRFTFRGFFRPPVWWVALPWADDYIAEHGSPHGLRCSKCNSAKIYQFVAPGVTFLIVRKWFKCMVCDTALYRAEYSRFNR